LPAREADRIAQRLVADPEHALDTLAREELGLNPAELGSAIGAAASSFVSFAAGALLPLLPFLLLPPVDALIATVAVSATALFLIGSALSLFTGRGALFSGASMLALGAMAGSVTYTIGRLFDVVIG
jgi:VIT1/CCC1 family predicted Fe2+/Mn2+ transporter